MTNYSDRYIDRYVVKFSELKDTDYVPISHPLAENTNLHLLPLSDRVGLTRLGLSLGRMTPGQKSFLPHAHAGQEEFIFIVAGIGVVMIDNEEVQIEAGDFVGFPTDGSTHQLRNDSTSELVYLMGGERTPTDVVSFPTIGKKGFWANGTMSYVDDDVIQEFAPEDFVVRSED
ncbi:MAG: cupin domain-containing protein [Pseudomonadota bacterium]